MNSQFDFEILDPSDETFKVLKTGNYPWWDILKKNENISIQIRKDNTIDIYYNGGAILSNLKYDVRKKEFTAQIHSKFIPLENESEYQSLSLSLNGVKFSKEIKTMDFSQFEEKKLSLIMNRIKQYYDAKSEKGIQFKFIANDPFIIDAEFQLNKKMRLDLVRLDKKEKKIVFIEVKTMGDSRLFVNKKDEEEKKDTPEDIYDQLKKYHNFAKDNADSILAYYEKILLVKNKLELTKPDVKGLSLKGWTVEPKPLLVFGDCKQAWINKYAASIDEKIKNVAYGAYYFGAPKYSLDLFINPKDNRHVYK